MPKRIKRKRTKGWRMPECAVYVGRPTKWGNPFEQDYISDSYNEQDTKYLAAWLFRDWMEKKIQKFIPQRNKILLNILELRGKDLACWCPLNQPCHADVLLELANEA